MGQIKIAIIGGDRRDLYLAEYLASQVFSVSFSGFESMGNFPAPLSRPLEAIADAQAVIMPLAGVGKISPPIVPSAIALPRWQSAFRRPASGAAGVHRLGPGAHAGIERFGALGRSGGR